MQYKLRQMSNIYRYIFYILLTVSINSILSSKDFIHITNSAYSETDPELIINPTNSNNLISSSLQHKYTYGKDNFINAISYSFDKGYTWQRYQQEVLPNEDYRLLIDARDNKLHYSSNGVAHLAWINTLVKTGFGGIDSIIQVINYKYSEDGGVNWIDNNLNYGRVKSNYDVTKEFNGLKQRFYNLKIFEYNLNTYISYSLHNVQNNLQDKIVLFNVNTPQNKIYIPIPDSLDYLGNYDIKIKNNKVHIAFLTTRYYLSLEYFQFDLVDKVIFNHQRIAYVNFSGTTLLPGVVSFLLPGIAPERVNPNPLVNFIDNEVLISWYGNEYSSENRFRIQKNNIYISKSQNGIFKNIQKVYSDTLNHQVLYDLRVNNNNIIAINFHSLEGPFENLNYNLSMSFIISLDGANSFTKPFTYSKKYELLHTTKKNFNYGIGYKNKFAIDDSHIYLSWVDGSELNGNTDISYSVFPLNFNENYDFSKDFKISSVYPNPFEEDLKINIFNNELQKIYVDLYDINGKYINRIFEDIVVYGENILQCNISNIAGGDYFIICKSDNNIIYQKILKIK